MPIHDAWDLSIHVGYLSSLVTIASGIVAAGLGLGGVRPAHASAGHAVTVAGLLRVLVGLGIHAAGTAIGAGDFDTDTRHGLLLALSLVGIGEHVVFWGLIGYAAWALAQARSGAPAVG